MTDEVNKESRLTAPMALAQMADELRVTFLAQQLSLATMVHPDLPVLRWHLSQLGAKDDFPIDVMRDEGSGIRFSAREVLTGVTRLASVDLRRDLLAGPMLIGVTRLGDAIQRADHYSKNSPLMQFARHFRNACAHGDRWHFTGEEPQHEAATREISLDKSMHGQRATWTTVDPHSYVLFLDQVHAYFVQTAFWAAADAAFEKAANTSEENVRQVLREELAARNMQVADKIALIGAVLGISKGHRFRIPVEPRRYGQVI